MDIHPLAVRGALPAPGDENGSAAARIFQYWYVLPPDRGAPSNRERDLPSLTRKDFYRVASADRESEYQGWIPAEAAIRWSHRQAVRPARRQPRAPAAFYESSEAARLIAGRHYSGKMIEARGGGDPEDFSSQVTSFLLGSLKSFEQIVLQAGGGLPATVTNLTAADFPYPVLGLVRQLPDAAPQGPDPRFSSRYCTDLDAEGNRVLIPHLFTHSVKNASSTSWAR